MRGKSRKVPILYAFLYKKVREKYRGYYIKPKELFEILKITMRRVPPQIRYAVLDEFENYKLLKKINKRRIRILKSDCYKNLDKLGVQSFWD